MSQLKLYCRVCRKLCAASFLVSNKYGVAQNLCLRCQAGGSFRIDPVTPLSEAEGQGISL